jgi:hypothetical protein
VTGAPRKTQARVDGDGVKIVEVAGVRRGVWLVVAGLLVAAAAVAIGLRLLLRDAASQSPDPAAAQVEPQAPGVSPPVAAATPRRVRPVRRADAPAPAPAPPGDVSAPAPTAPELPQFPDAPGDQPSGIALFPPLGTDPPKAGIVVPDDFELPEGYVRHYQATDDGASLPAILMFHPDYVWLDENGEPVALPDNRIVPPELAPPGLPPVLLPLPEPSPEPAP